MAPFDKRCDILHTILTPDVCMTLPVSSLTRLAGPQSLCGAAAIGPGD